MSKDKKNEVATAAVDAPPLKIKETVDAPPLNIGKDRVKTFTNSDSTADHD